MNPNLIRQIKQMQEEIQKVQKDIENTIFTFSSGGIVTVEMSGNKEIQKIIISDEFELKTKEDKELLADMITVAARNAVNEINKIMQNKLSKYAPYLNQTGMF